MLGRIEGKGSSGETSVGMGGNGVGVNSTVVEVGSGIEEEVLSASGKNVSVALGAKVDVISGTEVTLVETGNEVSEVRAEVTLNTGTEVAKVMEEMDDAGNKV